MENSSDTFERLLFEANISGLTSFKLLIFFPFIYLFLSLFTLFLRITLHLSTVRLLLWAFSPMLHFSYISTPSFRILKFWQTSLFCTLFHSTKSTLPDFSPKSQYHLLLNYRNILSLAFFHHHLRLHDSFYSLKTIILLCQISPFTAWFKFLLPET